MSGFDKYITEVSQGEVEFTFNKGIICLLAKYATFEAMFKNIKSIQDPSIRQRFLMELVEVLLERFDYVDIALAASEADILNEFEQVCLNILEKHLGNIDFIDFFKKSVRWFVLGRLEDAERMIYTAGTKEDIKVAFRLMLENIFTGAVITDDLVEFFRNYIKGLVSGDNVFFVGKSVKKMIEDPSSLKLAFEIVKMFPYRKEFWDTVPAGMMTIICKNDKSDSFNYVKSLMTCFSESEVEQIMDTHGFEEAHEFYDLYDGYVSLW